jgi:alpha-tubulin suppressor-like RCC1 family protein
MSNNNITKIAAWYEHTVILRNGKVWSFGRGDNGRLCVGTTVDNSLPQLIPISTEITDITVGNDHTLLLDSKEMVYTCGWNAVRNFFFNSKEWTIG